jgi:CIC family chloride channel protein
MTQALAGVGPELGLAMSPPELTHYPFFIGPGVLLGAAGVLFNHILLAGLDLFTIWSRRSGWSLVLALSLGLTFLLAVAPTATGGGEQIITALIVEPGGLGALCLLLALRTAATVGSYAAGMRGVCSPQF